MVFSKHHAFFILNSETTQKNHRSPNVKWSAPWFASSAARRTELSKVEWCKLALSMVANTEKNPWELLKIVGVFPWFWIFSHFFVHAATSSLCYQISSDLINSGIPQRSVLGLILFVLYTLMTYRDRLSLRSLFECQSKLPRRICFENRAILFSSTMRVMISQNHIQFRKSGN